LARRDFILGSGAAFLAACQVMSQVRATDGLIGAPHPDEWHPVLRSLIVTVLPFEHPSFPRVSADDLSDRLRELFGIEEDEDFASFPKALMLFEDCPLFETPAAPFVEDERRDLSMSRVAEGDIDRAVVRAKSRERAAWAAHSARFGQPRFLVQSLDARRAYLALWAESEFITCRRFYRGVKALVMITAYSTQPFWDAVGYDGPLHRHG
jgi:hypothetical protein